MSYSYNYGQGQPQQPYPPSGAATPRQDSIEPYSAGNSHARLNSLPRDDSFNGNNLRYRDDYTTGQRGYTDTTPGVEEKAGVRDSHGSHFSPTSARFMGDKESFKSWRKNHYETGIWTRGSGLACMGRFFCCTVLLTLLLLISVVLTIAVYIRPPDVQIGAVTLDTAAKTGAIERNATSITIHLKVPLTVKNPNFFDAGFTRVVANAFYPLGGVDTAIGGGEKSAIVFKKGTESTVDFPLSFQYSSSIDPDGTVIADIASRCGINGGTKRDLPIKYKIKVDLKIVVPTISPTFSGNANFACPLSASDFSLLAGGLLGTI